MKKFPNPIVQPWEANGGKLGGKKTNQSRGKNQKEGKILLMEEILHHLGCIKP